MTKRTYLVTVRSAALGDEQFAVLAESEEAAARACSGHVVRVQLAPGHRPQIIA